MQNQVQFGIRLPEFPLDGSNARNFRNQLVAYMDGVHQGFDSAWVADHFFPWLGSVDQREPTLEALTSLTYLMGRYPGLTFGSIVLAQSYRPPALLAKMVASMVTLTQGQFILGLGAGWKENEYHAYGYDFPSPGRRVDQLDEAVQVIRKMWTEDSPTFHGKYYHIEGAYCQPRPDPIPPILIGGSGRKKTLRVVAKYADMWNASGGTAEHYAEVLSVLRQHCQQVGRDYDTIVKTWLCDCVAVASTSEQARQIAQQSPMCRGPRTVTGTPEEVAQQLQAFIDQGCSHFMLRFADFPNQEGTKLFKQEVLPRLRG